VPSGQTHWPFSTTKVAAQASQELAVLPQEVQFDPQLAQLDPSKYWEALHVTHWPLEARCWSPVQPQSPVERIERLL